MSPRTKLAEALARRIAATGPITMAEFMTACLHDPQSGYYATRPALGAEGDFITAPLVSQMFGELLGVWAVECWTRLGRPSPFRLIELGPGDGTLMNDALRAARRVAPDFIAAADLWLVEASKPLIEVQRLRLSGGGLEPRWVGDLSGAPGDAPIVLMANELLDCLPARQFVKTDRGWAERMVGVGAGGDLAFGLTPTFDAIVPAALRSAPVGSVVETCAAQERLGRTVGERIALDGGVALFIDYGRDGAELGDTIQALSKHQKVDPLLTAGEADLTVHADFPAFAEAARSAGALTTPIITQAALLAGLGIEARAEHLARSHPDKADSLARQFDRLTGADQMGVLFKAVAIYAPELEVPGF